MLRGLGILIALGLTVSVYNPTFAHDAPKDAPAAEAAAAPAEEKGLTIQDLMEGVVKVQVVQANVFEPEPEASHGSGFIVDIDKNGKGVIFTNRHVIQTNDLNVQSINLEFTTSQRRPEVIPGKVAYISRIHDFAVIEFDAKLLKRAHPRILALAHPGDKNSPPSPFFDFVANERLLRGQEVVSIGHPLHGTNISTKGEITGLQIYPTEGHYIQTQTPSNPGNSGGPLIWLANGEVVGITSAGISSADGINYSIPIGLVYQEYVTWRNQVAKGVRPNIAAPRSVGFMAHLVSESEAKALGHYDVVAKEIPGFWEEHDGVLSVLNTNESSHLEPDDVLLRLNGQPVGGYLYNLYRLVQVSPPTAEFEILRKGKVIKLKTEIADMEYDYRRRSIDYVYISGMVVTEMSRGSRRITRPELTSGLQVNGLVSSPETKFAMNNFPPPGSVITSVKFGDQEYRVNTLFELKQALNENRDKKTVQIRAYRSNWVQTDNGARQLRSNMMGTLLLDGVESVFLIPMSEVLTSMQFSLHQFKEQFQFSIEEARTHNWRSFIKADNLPSSCEGLLGSAKTVAQATVQSTK